MGAIKCLLIDRQSLYKGYPAGTLHSYCLIVPFYVPAKIGCNAKQYYERPTILCHL